MTEYKIQKFPKTRIATIDVCEIGKKKHHVAGMIELDVTNSRKKIREFNRQHVSRISFNAWLISVISSTIKKYELSFLKGKNRLLFSIY